METSFDLLHETERSNFLRLLMQSFQCTYVCFWSFDTGPINYLRFQDGIYHDEFNTQLPSSSSGSFAQRLFYEYQQSKFLLHAESDRVPGYAFRNSIPYLEFEESQLRRLASNESQRQFYQEARIKMAVFMGCKSGEIELGLSNVPTMKMQAELQRFLLPETFQISTQNTQPQLGHRDLFNNPLPTDHQNPHYSSSSSSLRSLSNIDSPEYSSLLFNINATSSSSQIQDQILSHTQQALRHPITPSSIMSNQETMQALARLRNPQFPSPEAEQETMKKAYLAVLTSSLPPLPINTKSSAFKNYSSASLSTTTTLDRRFERVKSMFKRSITFFQCLNLLKNRHSLQIPRPNNTTQLHHVISERKRREKLNESFAALRSLLPPGTKKDKASLLNDTKEYLTSLKARVEELNQRVRQLETQISPPIAANKEGHNHGEGELALVESNSPSDQRAIDVRLRHVSESVSDDHQTQIVDLQVILRAAIPINDLVLGVLEFLKRIDNISLMSLEANTTNLTESRTPINRVTLRLTVEGNQWDESAFQEAVRRVVANLTP